MKMSSWKSVLLYLAIIAAIYLAYSFVSPGGGISCNSISDYPDNSASTEYHQNDAKVGSDEIHVSDLPPEALDTLRLIEDGGTFPYSKDGTVFSNHEGLLSKKPSGYYREYTVKTPGSPDRGARRIVAGNGGEYYYTDDHYRSFKRIVG